MPRITKIGSSSRPRKASTRAAIQLNDAKRQVPPIPKTRKWHPSTVLWWREVWESPVSDQYLGADCQELSKLILLEDDFHLATEPKERLALIAEIRLQRQCFGLTPIDRRRLQWTVEKARKPRSAESAHDEATKDPRDYFIRLDHRDLLDVI